jgi:hypothetical protein
MPLLTGDCLTTNSSSNCRLKTLLIAAAPRYIASARTAQETPPAVPPLLRHVSIDDYGIQCTVWCPFVITEAH